MKKVLDRDLEGKVAGIIGGPGSKAKSVEIVDALKELQDAGGLKVCMNINKADPAYREVF